MSVYRRLFLADVEHARSVPGNNGDADAETYADGDGGLPPLRVLPFSAPPDARPLLTWRVSVQGVVVQNHLAGRVIRIDDSTGTIAVLCKPPATTRSSLSLTPSPTVASLQPLQHQDYAVGDWVHVMGHFASAADTDVGDIDADMDFFLVADHPPRLVSDPLAEPRSLLDIINLYSSPFYFSSRTTPSQLTMATPTSAYFPTLASGSSNATTAFRFAPHSPPPLQNHVSTSEPVFNNDDHDTPFDDDDDLDSILGAIPL